MKTANFSVEISASAPNVWFALWDDYCYRKWSSVFCEGSYAKTDNWNDGTVVHFLTPSGVGMYSKITESIVNTKMAFTHLGHLKDFVEQPLDEESMSWNGAKEIYTLTEINGITILSIEIDIVDKYTEYFNNILPVALKQIKEIAEDLYITIGIDLNSSINNVWQKWSNPDDITKWCFASDTWHSPSASNDLRIGGRLNCRMESKDGEFGFDFGGTYTNIIPNELIEFVMDDGRDVSVRFESKANQTHIIESFRPESENALELQKFGWQEILNNFKRYVDNE